MSAGFDLDAHATAMARDGYTLILDWLSPAQLEAVRTGLSPFLGRHRGRNNFEGHATERIYTLVARGAVFEAITEESRVLALCERFLSPGFLLTASQAINIHPGETPQPIHTDDSFYRIPRPRPAVSVSVIAAIDAFTADNGGTGIIPGSHAWGDDAIAGMYDGVDADIRMPERLARRLQPVEMPAGAAVVFLGTLLHRGGGNRSAASRLAITNQYCEPWARTQENFFLGVPAERVRAMSPRLQALLGYSIWPPFMGHVTAAHPLRILAPGHRNAVLAQHGADAETGA